MKKFALLTIAAMMLSLVGYAGPASAAALTVVSDTMSVQTPSVVSNHTFSFVTPSGVPAAGTITVTFPAAFNLGALAFGDLDLTDDAVDLVLAAAPSGTEWGAVVSGQVVTFTNGSAAVAAASVITIEMGLNATFGTAGTVQITNPAATGSHLIVLTAGADTGYDAVPIVITGPTDTVTVTGTIESSITHTLSTNACALGVITPGATNYNYCTYTSAVSTNATDGYASTIVALADVDASITLNNDADFNQFFADPTGGSVDGSQTTTSEYGVSTSEAGYAIANATCAAAASVLATALTASPQQYAGSTVPAVETTTLCHSAAAGTSSPGTGTYTQQVRLIVTGTF